MSLTLGANKARLTVFGYGWAEEVIDSGDATTEEGVLLHSLLTDTSSGLDYTIDDFGGVNMDWDKMAEYLDIDMTDGYYIGDDGTEYYDYDSDGVYESDLGIEYDGLGEYQLSEESLSELNENLATLANNEEALYDCMMDTGDSTESPARIIVTNPPDVTEYAEGDTIDYTGIVVCAYTSLTTRTPFIQSDWDGPRHNQVPYEELTFPVTTAIKESMLKTISDTTGLSDEVISALPITCDDFMSLSYTGLYNSGWKDDPSPFVNAAYTSPIYVFVLLYNGFYSAYLVSKNYFSMTEHSYNVHGNYSGAISGTATEVNGKTFYYATVISGIWESSMTSISPSANELYGTHITEIGYVILYGEDVGTTVSIPVQWQTDYQTDPYEDTFDITVT